MRSLFWTRRWRTHKRSTLWWKNYSSTTSGPTLHRVSPPLPRTASVLMCQRYRWTLHTTPSTRSTAAAIDRTSSTVSSNNSPSIHSQSPCLPQSRTRTGGILTGWLENGSDGERVCCRPSIPTALLPRPNYRSPPPCSKNSALVAERFLESSHFSRRALMRTTSNGCFP